MRLGGISGEDVDGLLQTNVRAFCIDLSLIITGMRIIVMQTTNRPTLKRRNSWSFLQSVSISFTAEGYL